MPYRHMAIVLLAEELKELGIFNVKRNELRTGLPEFSDSSHENTSLYPYSEMIDIWLIETPVGIGR